MIEQTNVQKAYIKINWVLAGIILGIFLYSGLFSYEFPQHPIPSQFTKITGYPSSSTGLSRSFSAIVRGEFNEAHQLNPYGLDIFLFFLLQLIFRIGGIFLIKSKKTSINKLLFADICLSLFTFLLAFRGMILFLFKLSKYLLVN
ncbi:MAG: DUF2752 domain-containing protein [Marinifilaceae bacterium]